MKGFFLAFFSLLIGMMLSMVLPVNAYAASGLVFLMFLFVPSRPGILAMNGIEAREDFKNVVQIFDNAFNPRFVFNQQANAWQPNPKYQAVWDPVSAFRLTQSTVRMEQPLSTQTNRYTFPILNNIQNQGQQFNTEIRLAQQNTFVPTHIGFFLGYPSSTTDTTFKPYAYPNQFVSAQPVQEQAVYNGQLTIMIQNVQYLQNWDLWRHWKANQTQQTAALGAGSPQDEFSGADDGWYPMQPFVLMIGSQDIQININIPVTPTAVTENARLILMFRGVLSQQSTVVN